LIRSLEKRIRFGLGLGILISIQFLNASISSYETTKAGDAVAALKVIKNTLDFD
jgi:hypothetical protein